MTRYLKELMKGVQVSSKEDIDVDEVDELVRSVEMSAIVFL